MIRLLKANESGRTRWYLHARIGGSYFVLSRFGLSWTPQNGTEHSVVYVVLASLAVAALALLAQ
jgi:hypothetical protein